MKKSLVRNPEQLVSLTLLRAQMTPGEQRGADGVMWLPGAPWPLSATLQEPAHGRGEDMGIYLGYSSELHPTPFHRSGFLPQGAPECCSYE